MDAHQLKSWDDLRFFLGVARKGSLSGAAKELGVNHSTVYRRIAGLEEGVGARLFDRLASGYELTAEGELMLEFAERIEDEVTSLGRQVLGRDRKMTGTVRVTTVEEILGLLAPCLLRFSQLHPGIAIEVNTDQRLLSLSQREADVAIRPGRRSDEADVVGRKLCELTTAAYVSADFAERHGLPDSSSDLRDFPLVTWDKARQHLDHFKWFLRHSSKENIAFSSNSMLGQQAAVLAGFGVGLLPSFMGDRCEGLVRAFGPEQGPSRYGLWLLVHADLRQTARVRAFIDFISEALVAQTDLFEGRA